MSSQNDNNLPATSSGTDGANLLDVYNNMLINAGFAKYGGLYKKTSLQSEIVLSIGEGQYASAWQVANPNDPDNLMVLHIFKAMPIPTTENLDYLIQHPFIKVP